MVTPAAMQACQPQAQALVDHNRNVNVEVAIGASSSSRQVRTLMQTKTSFEFQRLH